MFLRVWSVAMSSVGNIERNLMSTVPRSLRLLTSQHGRNFLSRGEGETRNTNIKRQLAGMNV